MSAGDWNDVVLVRTILNGGVSESKGGRGIERRESWERKVRERGRERGGKDNLEGDRSPKIVEMNMCPQVVIFLLDQSLYFGPSRQVALVVNLLPSSLPNSILSWRLFYLGSSSLIAWLVLHQCEMLVRTCDVEGQIWDEGELQGDRMRGCLE